jgi:hypothetical protein
VLDTACAGCKTTAEVCILETTAGRLKNTCRCVRTSVLLVVFFACVCLWAHALLHCRSTVTEATLLVIHYVAATNLVRVFWQPTLAVTNKTEQMQASRNPCTLGPSARGDTFQNVLTCSDDIASVCVAQLHAMIPLSASLVYVKPVYAFFQCSTTKCETVEAFCAPTNLTMHHSGVCHNAQGRNLLLP